MAVSVRIPTALRKLTEGQAEIEVEGHTVREVFANIESSYAGIQAKVIDDSGEIKRFVNLFLNGEDVRYLKGLDTEVSAGDEMSIVPAIAGGN